MDYPTELLLKYSFAAYRTNGYQYVKHTQEYNRVFSNRDLILRTLKEEYWPPADECGGFQKLEVIQSDLDALEEAKVYMRRYTLLSLGNLGQFQRDTYTAYIAETTSEKNIGLVAYFPAFYEREVQDKAYKQTLKQEYSDSQYIFDKTFENRVKVLKVIPLHDYGKYMHVAGVNGNLVSFAIRERYQVDSVVNIRAKIKSQDRERDTGYALTQLNYVKVLEG